MTGELICVISLSWRPCCNEKQQTCTNWVTLQRLTPSEQQSIPKGYMLYTSISVTFLKWQNCRKEEQTHIFSLGLVMVEGWEEEEDGGWRKITVVTKGQHDGPLQVGFIQWGECGSVDTGIYTGDNVFIELKTNRCK